MFRLIGRKIGAGFGAAARIAPVVLRDAVGLAAVGLIAYGAWLVHPAAGFIAGGSLLLAGVMLASGRAPG